MAKRQQRVRRRQARVGLRRPAESRSGGSRWWRVGCAEGAAIGTAARDQARGRRLRRAYAERGGGIRSGGGGVRIRTRSGRTAGGREAVAREFCASETLARRGRVAELSDRVGGGEIWDGRREHTMAGGGSACDRRREADLKYHLLLHRTSFSSLETSVPPSVLLLAPPPRTCASSPISVTPPCSLRADFPATLLRAPLPQVHSPPCSAARPPSSAAATSSAFPRLVPPRLGCVIRTELPLKSICYDVFSCSFYDVIYDSKQEVEKLEAKVKELLKATKNDPLEQVNLINALQRLGVGYRFTIEIEEALKEIHDSTPDFLNNDHDLYATALYFQLLRQQGYKISCDVFYKFKDNDNGDFKSDLRDDVKGMLSLYEACHLKVHGEDILEEALNFTTTHLKSALMTNLGSSNLGNQVQYALEQPLHKGMPRLEARNYISLYQEECKWSNVLKKLAVLDFNLVQSFHKKELSDVSKWWKDLDFASKLPFARDRLVECYFWTVGAYFEPSYSLARMFMTKVIALTSTIDDIYDVYGTLAELELFTDAIEKYVYTMR
ncbi:hypothetical protein Syun_010298 [Stephania yunnanensis]|uniref:Uncharacterized protein n=1 Tax=Stephania yunnanensis TaxID=152371 RepID=A0AAP0PRI4_9MAGN